VQIAFNTIPAFLPHVKAGRLKALVITAPARSPLLPEVPATPEVGLAALQGGSWHAVVAPAGTPREISRSSTDARRDARGTGAARAAREPGRAAVGGSPEELRRFMQVEAEKWGRVIQSSGARAE